jgi:anti-sigma factor RsiW
MNCGNWQEKLDAYLDAELPEAEARELNAHLRSCPSCSLQALAHSELKRSLHLAGKKFTPDREFRKRVQANINPKASGHRWGWIVEVAIACAAVLLVLFGSIVWLRQSQRQQLIGELTDLHVATLASANRVDVVSSDRHTVKPWFQGKVPFTFNVPDLQGSPFELVGGKVSYLDQNPGAELLFAVRKHVLSVFIFKDSTQLDRALGAGELLRKFSFNIESWTDGGLRYVIITDASRADVDDLRRRFALAAQ